MIVRAAAALARRAAGIALAASLAVGAAATESRAAGAPSVDALMGEMTAAAGRADYGAVAALIAPADLFAADLTGEIEGLLATLFKGGPIRVDTLLVPMQGPAGESRVVSFWVEGQYLHFFLLFHRRGDDGWSVIYFDANTSYGEITGNF